MKTNRKTSWPGAVTLIVIGVILFFLWLFNSAYITPLLVGFIFAALTFPVYNYFSNLLVKYLKWRPNWDLFAALITILLFSLVIILFGNIFVRELIREIPGFAKEGLEFVQNAPQNQTILNLAANIGLDKDGVTSIVNNFQSQANQILGYFNPDVPKNTNQPLSQLLNQSNVNRAVDIGQQILGVVFDQLVYLVIFILAWLNGLVSGRNWLNSIFSILPLNEDEIKDTKKDLAAGIRNVIYANLLSGLINAVAVFLIMLVFGLPNIFIVSLLVFLIGVLPLTPSEIGYAIPILMLFPKNPVAAALLIPVAEIIVLWVNYVLVPKVIASGEEGNPLLILTSILSGITIFGLMGFIIGPVIMIFVQTLYRILRKRLSDNEGGEV